MKHVTLVVPYVAHDEAHINITRTCIESFKDLYSTLVLVENGGEYPNELWKYADIFIKNRMNRMMAGAINQAYLLAKYNRATEYLWFSNNDIRNDKVEPDKLCQDGGLYSPRIGGQPQELGAHASFFSCRLDVFDKVGLWNRDEGTAADKQWFDRVVAAGYGLYMVDGHVYHDHLSLTNKLNIPPNYE